MIDFHNHVLPGLDDGSKNIEQTLSMLKTASDQGITDVICTVHYQHPKMDGIDINYDIVKDSINSVEEQFNGKLNLHPGSEVFYLPNLTEIKSDPLTVFGHGEYMLIEFQSHQLPPGYDEELYRLVMSGTTPIIAHPERYKPIQNDINIVEKLINSGCLMQIDAGSLLGYFGQNCKKSVELMVLRNMVHFVGSDSHNDSKRNFCLELAVKRCEELIGDLTTSLVYDNPQKLLNGEKIIPWEIVDGKENKEGFIKSILRRIKLN